MGERINRSMKQESDNSTKHSKTLDIQGFFFVFGAQKCVVAGKKNNLYGVDTEFVKGEITWDTPLRNKHNMTASPQEEERKGNCGLIASKEINIYTCFYFPDLCILSFSNMYRCGVYC
jgi:hypothetical protein